MNKAITLCVLQLIASSVGAQTSRKLPTVETLMPGEGPHRLALPVPASDAEIAARRTELIRGPLAQFLEGEGRGWRVVFDRRSGLPMLLDGPGLALSGKSAKGRAGGMLARYQSMFGVDDPATSLAEEGTEDLAFAHARKSDGSARESRITFVFNHGRLIQIHARKWLPKHRAAKTLDADEALQQLRAQIAMPSPPLDLQTELSDVALATTDEPPGVYTGPFGRGYETHYAYIFRFTLVDDTRTFVAYIDAESGVLLDFFDDNRYEGLVSGGIFPRTGSSSEVLAPFALAKVNAGTTVVTDLGGRYPYPGGTASTKLAGDYFDLSDNCGQISATTMSAPGDLDLGVSVGTDCSGGPSTRAARNAFFHLNNVRQMGLKWLEGVNSTATDWFKGNLPVKLNITQTCNAYWDGSSVNFFRSGGGCANTGEISDVMQHEWGHGLDAKTKSGSIGDSAKGEAVADGVALLMTHDQCIGPGFLTSGSGGETSACPSAVRDLAFVVTQANISKVCQKTFGCTGALGYECHCESHILSGAYWKLQQKFVERYGTDEGWNRFERGFLLALPNTTSYLPNTAGNAYDAWLAVDDDNGNLTDGTPNADIIYAAFSGQGIAGPQLPRHAVACVNPPTGPVATAVSTPGAIALSWSAVPDATAYAVFRRIAPTGQLASISPAFLPLARGLTATSYTDTQIAPGFDYQYQVVAQAGDCTSPYGVAVTGTGMRENDFSISLAPAHAIVAAGGMTTFTVQTNVVTGSAETVTLSVSDLPSGVTGSFNPGSVSADGSATLTLTAAANAPAATSALFMVTGTAPGATHSASGTLSVTGDFELKVTPSTVVLSPDESRTVTIKTEVLSGGPESISLSFDGLPAGVSAVLSSPTVVTGGSASIQFSASGKPAPATATVTITAANPSVSHTTPLKMKVQRK